MGGGRRKWHRPGAARWRTSTEIPTENCEYHKDWKSDHGGKHTAGGTSVVFVHVLGEHNTYAIDQLFDPHPRTRALLCLFGDVRPGVKGDCNTCTCVLEEHISGIFSP